MGYEMKVVSYEQTREDYFRDQMARAEMQLKAWQSRLRAAKNTIQEMEAHDNASNAGWIYNYYKDAIEALSSIQHGRWIEPYKNDIWDCYECSCCGSKFDRTWKFCPNCGAKLDLEG